MVLPAVDSERSFLAELFLGLVHLSNKVYESFGRLGYALFRPVGELELPDGPRPVVDSVCHFELSEYVLRHVVLRDWFNNESVVPDGPLRRPVLIAFFLKKKTSKNYRTVLYSGRGWWCLTRPISWSLVSMTTMVELCSHNMRQKSSAVICRGPCVAMYAPRCL